MMQRNRSQITGYPERFTEVGDTIPIPCVSECRVIGILSAVNRMTMVQ